MAEDIETKGTQQERLHSPEASAISVSNSVGISSTNLALSLLEQSDDCVKLLSVEGRLEYMNCAGIRSMQIDKPSDVLGNIWWEMWPPETRKWVRDAFHQALAGSTIVFKAICPTARGAHRRWSVNLKPLVTTSGGIVSVLCTSRDITPK